MTSSAVRKNRRSGVVEQDGAGKRRAMDPGREGEVTVIDGNQKVARARTSGRGMGVEVLDRDLDDDRERDDVVSDRAARSQRDRGRTYTP